MIILNYTKKHHKQIIHACVKSLKQGLVIAYPTDTSYGLAVDATNLKAIKKLYKVKGRDFKKAVSVIAPSPDFTKKIGEWGSVESRLAKKFWPGALTIAIELRSKNKELRVLSAKSGYLAVRVPKSDIALDLAHQLGSPITATSANVAGMPDCYSAESIVKQYKNLKLKPDIIINVGKLPKKKPSTLVKVSGDEIEIIRRGPISEKQIRNLKPKT